MAQTPTDQEGWWGTILLEVSTLPGWWGVAGVRGVSGRDWDGRNGRCGEDLGPQASDSLPTGTKVFRYFNKPVSLGVYQLVSVPMRKQSLGD